MTVRLRTPVVAIVTTRASPCRCGDAWAAAIRALGLEALPVAVEEASARRDDLAGAALVIEYVDTYRGKGELRPLVRHQLASWGARLVGAPAEAAQLSDDKVAAREALARAGLAVARARLLTPAGLGANGGTFPAVVKRPFEHGSRGVSLVRNRAGLEALAARWFRKGDAALLVEEFVDGRELALSVVEEEHGPRCLPPIEVDLPRGAICTRGRKWGRREPGLRPAAVSAAEAETLRAAALAAFGALGLRDLARFDVRLGATGPVFLEANARPSVEPALAFPFAASLGKLTWVDAARLVLLSAARRHGLPDLLRRLKSAEV